MQNVCRAGCVIFNASKHDFPFRKHVFAPNEHHFRTNENVFPASEHDFLANEHVFAANEDVFPADEHHFPAGEDVFLANKHDFAANEHHFLFENDIARKLQILVLLANNDILAKHGQKEPFPVIQAGETAGCW